MKKFITILFFVLIGAVVYSQSATVQLQKLTAVTASVAGGTGTITLPPIMGEYDIDLQLIPSLTGSGDTLDFTYVLYQSNSLSDNIWSIFQTTSTVTSADDADALTAITDWGGVRLRAICTVTTDDTVTVTPYYVAKKHANE